MMVILQKKFHRLLQSETKVVQLLFVVVLPMFLAVASCFISGCEGISALYCPNTLGDTRSPRCFGTLMWSGTTSVFSQDVPFSGQGHCVPYDWHVPKNTCGLPTHYLIIQCFRY